LLDLVDRLIVLDNSRLLMDGSKEEILAKLGGTK
jgi:ATP-binding cassette subfamily C protein LapB